MENILDQRQQAAVNADAPEIVCPAPAGSGKTRVLVARVRRLIDSGVAPEDICVITFTNAAAKELQKRLRCEACGGQGGTEYGGVGPEGENDTREWLPCHCCSGQQARIGYCGTLHSLMLKLLRLHGTKVGLPSNVTVMDEETAGALLEQCREELRVKCSGVALERAVDEARRGMTSTLGTIHTVATEYLNRQRQTGELDFDQLLRFGLRLLRVMTFPYSHLLVDEAQDSAPIDWAIYDSVSCLQKFFCGDDSQAIYGFRGGDVEQFVAKAKTAVTVPLAVNYRSATEIVALSQRAVAGNAMRIENQAVAQPGAELGKVFINEYASPINELSAVAARLPLMQHNGSVAVLWRTNAQADQCREYLQGLGITLAATKRADKDTEAAKTAKAALAWACNPWSDRAALKLAVLLYGEKNTSKMKDEAQASMTSPSQLFRMQLLRSDYPEDSGSLLAALPLDAGVSSWLVQLRSTLPDSATPEDLLVAALRPDDTEPLTPGVFVGTVHSAKGLEWDTVFGGGLEDEAWPGRDSEEDGRRLLYVAVTRAKTNLFLSWCSSRPDPFAEWKQNTRKPSRFLAELAIEK